MIPQNKNVIAGLENFTFIDVPPDEVEIIRELKKNDLRRKKRENRRSRIKDGAKDEQPNSSSPVQRINNKPSLVEGGAGSTLIHHRHESYQGNFTLSNKSIVTFEESNQSIA